MLVTHHLDEVPDGMTHVMMLRHGVVVATGPIDDTLRADTLSECFEMPLQLERRDDGRWLVDGLLAGSIAPAPLRTRRTPR